jgi:raffinose/stachyose/melibiose transport system substrate-binding protein
LPGGSALNVASLIVTLAVPRVYASDKHWTAELKAGTVSFDAAPGWQTALHEFVEVNDAGCFQPGATGASTPSVLDQFAQGQSLMTQQISSQKGLIDAADPQFPYSIHPFPGGSGSSQTVTYLKLRPALSVNAHSSPANQAAAQEFIDFVARPKQNALYAQTTGGLTQYQFLKQELPSFMSTPAAVFQGTATS